jgi:hypothetical protein
MNIRNLIDEVTAEQIKSNILKEQIDLMNKGVTTETDPEAESNDFYKEYDERRLFGSKVEDFPKGGSVYGYEEGDSEGVIIQKILNAPFRAGQDDYIMDWLDYHEESYEYVGREV